MVKFAARCRRQLSCSRMLATAFDGSTAIRRCLASRAAGAERRQSAKSAADTEFTAAKAELIWLRIAEKKRS